MEYNSKLVSAAAYLKAHTKQLHQLTEAVAYGQKIMDHSLTLALYQDLIRKNYYIHYQLDENLENALSKCKIATLSDLFQSRTLQLYQDMDLLSLYPPKNQIQAPLFRNTPDLLGGLYVLLGSTLGGRVIHRALLKNPHLSSIPYFHFFTAAQQFPSTSWPRFCRILEQYLQTESELITASQSAAATFRFFHDVYATRLS